MLFAIGIISYVKSKSVYIYGHFGDGVLSCKGSGSSRRHGEGRVGRREREPESFDDYTTSMISHRTPKILKYIYCRIHK